jgi:hypothetical protein
MDTKCPNQYFMFDCSIYRLFVLSRGWKRESFQIMIFEYVCSTWIIVELKTHFQTSITRNNLNGVSLFHLSYLITLMAYQCTHRTLNVQIKYFMFDWSINRLFVQTTCWKRDDDILKNLLDMKHGWMKNAFWDVNNKIWRKGCVCFKFHM